EKGAVFLKSEHDNSYNCLSSTGYDKTTTNRLRLDANSTQNSAFTSMQSDKKSTRGTEAVSFLKDFMSSREFGLIEEIFWLPFFHANEIYSLIMISDWKGMIPDDCMTLFNRISTDFSQKMYNSRRALSRQDNTETRTSGKQDLLATFKGLSGRDVFIIEVNLKPLISELLSRKKGLSIINLKNEILRVFKTMAGSGQEVLGIDTDRILMILDKNRVPDKSLFIHQLSSSLPLLFHDLTIAPELATKEYDVPQSDEELDELIKALI
ncbi:MAG: hypothetical protein PQJ58_09325, partial [Spirochaetales bacterium]|nr:hypothetical protein [Spirochaetales bacterium]